jgi:RND family efflux transporter MFP subunit
VRYLPLATIIIATAAAAACSRAPEATPPAQMAPISVTTARAAVTELPATFEAGGIVRARVTAAIASRMMAPITEVHVHTGDRVHRGAPLVSLDAREMTANRDRALAAAVAAQESSGAADADVAAAEANLALARVTHQRVADLVARKSATPQELDQAVAALTAADAQLRAARARRAAADAGRDAARAASSAADTGLTYTQLTAPFDAVVSERFIDPGAMATPGTPLLMLEDPASFRLEVRLDESRSAQVQVGQPVECSVGNAADDGSGRGWATGRVAEVARLDSASHAFVVKIDLPADTDVRSGSFGRARFSGPSRRALTVPESSLVRRGQLSFVFAVDANNVARLRAVSPGAVAAGRVETLAGVSDGDLIVLGPPPALTDGRPVQAASQVARGDGR